jgi:hypothetical protein
MQPPLVYGIQVDRKAIPTRRNRGAAATGSDPTTLLKCAFRLDLREFVRRFHASEYWRQREIDGASLRHRN